MKRSTLCLCAAICLLAGSLSGCAKGNPEAEPPAVPSVTPTPSPTPTPPPIKNPAGGTVSTRFNPPAGYARIELEPGGFGAYLRELPLKVDGAPVLLLGGQVRDGAPAAATLRMEIAATDHQEGTDALIRLRAEYLYQSEQTDVISYHFLSGFACAFSKWSDGYRIRELDIRRVEWQQRAEPSATYGELLSYLNTLFLYANAASLSDELLRVSDPRPGDVFVNSKSGGVMIMDMAQNPADGEQVFLLAQSRIPTQEIYLLRNDSRPDISPWYDVNQAAALITAEGGVFAWTDLGRFDEMVGG
ncbi:MAG: DUF4846 domain-containing protein [Oscillospiraceae bacterium]|nr:DUF4846 domain-containing protein [Oscillospiraceae bacterium]